MGGAIALPATLDVLIGADMALAGRPVAGGPCFPLADILSVIRSADGKMLTSKCLQYELRISTSVLACIEEVPAHTAILQDFVRAGLDFAPLRR